VGWVNYTAKWYDDTVMEPPKMGFQAELVHVFKWVFSPKTICNCPITRARTTFHL